MKVCSYTALPRHRTGPALEYIPFSKATWGGGGT